MINHWLGLCNLCGWPVVRYSKSWHGSRCVRCLSTQVHRAAGRCVQQLNLPRTASVYELSSRGALFRFLQLRFSQFYCSEYFDDVAPGNSKQGVICQDVQKLLLDDARFDLVTSTEVFEHVPNDSLGFAEVFRVLKPDGHFILTVPLFDAAHTVERCVLRADGSLEHRLPPEYHGDRIRGQGRVLAFRNYGRDIVDRMNAVGFATKIVCVEEARCLIDKSWVVVGHKPS